MRILNLSLRTSSLPLKQAFTTALRSVESIDEVIVTLHTQDFTALGSAPATLAVTGDDIQSISKDLKETVFPAFTGYNVLDYESTFIKLSKMDICSSARAAMDIALHDLLAQMYQQPLYQFLGGKTQNLKTMYTISIDTAQKMLTQAKEQYKLGFTQLKIKLDSDVSANIERVELLAKTLPQAELFLDINQACDLNQSKELIKALAHLPIKLLEQPLPANDIKGMQELTALKTLPILADESVFSYADAQKVIALKACDLINIKLMKCGGIYEARNILELCQKENIKCMMGSMLEGGISVTAALHLAYAYDNVIYADLDGPTLAVISHIEGGIAYEGMKLSLSPNSGLGLSLKEII